MAQPTATANDLIFRITEDIHVEAPIVTTFEALLEELGPSHQVAEDRPLPMKLEPWPGGRWYRDLGNDNGHLWGHVQAIKRPTLVEISGPLLFSSAVVSNLQYRLSEVDGGTLIKFVHNGMGMVPEEQRVGITGGWAHSHARVRIAAENAARK